MIISTLILSIAMVFGQPDLTLDEIRMIPSMYFTQETYTAGACEINECLMHLKGGTFPKTVTLLRFDIRAVNVGTEDFNLGQPSLSNPNFVYDQCHDHWHFEEFAQYEVFNESSETINLVPETGKRAFCLMDTSPYADFVGPRRSSRRYTCNQQGISVGWQDIYGANLPCQFVDVSALAPGNYILKITLNPSGLLNDFDITNNVARLPFIINGPPTPPGTPDVIVPAPDVDVFPGNEIGVIPGVDINCNVSNPSWLGDGYCDRTGGYNTAECRWDLGDCCSECCQAGRQHQCGVAGYECLNPTCMQLELACDVENEEWIGDGYCDQVGQYNTERCNFDGGDCCAACCTDGPFYTCGARDQPRFDCQNPSCAQYEIRFPGTTPIA